MGWFKVHWIALLAALGGLLLGGAVGVAGSISNTATTTATVVSTDVQTTTATQVSTATVTKTNTVVTAATPTDCPGRVHNGGAGIGSISVVGATCDTAMAVLAASDHLGWTCRDLGTGVGLNGFPGICEHGDGQTIHYASGD